MTALLDEEPRLTALPPLAYGYMRVPCDVPDDKVRKLEQRLRAFAASHGLYFVTFFFEFSCGSREAFDELVTELQRADAHYVVVPSFGHFARSVLLQNSMLAQLEHDAQAEVLALRESDERK
ncbi:recombinase family protein [Amycolatopsis tolypomycina]|uniref:recombinase family protein n=1 Tax=Amycolatopsis tolypomycina TaxID=208445 RepID=UPI0033A1F85D